MTEEAEITLTEAQFDKLGEMWLRQVRNLVRERDHALRLATALVCRYGGEASVPISLLNNPRLGLDTTSDDMTQTLDLVATYDRERVSFVH